VNRFLQDKNINIRNISIPRLSRDIKILDEIFVFFDLLKIILKERPNVIHLNSSKIGGLGSLAGHIYNLSKNKDERSKIVFTAHGWAFNESRSFISIFIIKIVSLITSILSHEIIVVSEFDKRSSSWMPFVQKKITRIYNGININTKFEDREKARKIILGTKAKKYENYKWIGTIAELTKNKGLSYGIEGFRNFIKKTKAHKKENYIYVIIGEGEDREKIENYIKINGLEKEIFIVGFKNNASSLLNAFDVFVFPSIKEGFPYALLETGVAKLPTIATTVGGIPEIIDNIKSGILVRPKRNEEITSALRIIFSDKNKADMLGKVLYENISQRFSLSDMVLKTIHIYDK